MNENTVGLKYLIDKVGYIKTEHEKSVHAVKSIAGRHFHADTVKSVCVYNSNGDVALYLKKTANGIVREENF